MFNKFGADETVEIKKNDLDALHMLAAIAGSICERSLSREAAILLLAQAGLGKSEVLDLLDSTGSLIDLQQPTPESKAQSDEVFRALEDIVSIAYAKKA